MLFLRETDFCKKKGPIFCKSCSAFSPCTELTRTSVNNFSHDFCSVALVARNAVLRTFLSKSEWLLFTEQNELNVEKLIEKFTNNKKGSRKNKMLGRGTAGSPWGLCTHGNGGVPWAAPSCICDPVWFASLPVSWKQHSGKEWEPSSNLHLSVNEEDFQNQEQEQFQTFQCEKTCFEAVHTINSFAKDKMMCVAFFFLKHTQHSSRNEARKTFPLAGWPTKNGRREVQSTQGLKRATAGVLFKSTGISTGKTWSVRRVLQYVHDYLHLGGFVCLKSEFSSESCQKKNRVALLELINCGMTSHSKGKLRFRQLHQRWLVITMLQRWKCLREEKIFFQKLSHAGNMLVYLQRTLCKKLRKDNKLSIVFT